MPLVTDPLDRNANPDPLRTLRTTVAEDGAVHFTVDFQAPGSFQGVFVPGSVDEPSGVVAYVYPVVAADLDVDVEPVTCLDTYDIDIPQDVTPRDTPADMARALEAAVALVQALSDARLAGTSMVDASLALEDWAVAAADLLPDEAETPPTTESVFRDGFAAGWGAKASESIYSEETEADEAWKDSGLK